MGRSRGGLTNTIHGLVNANGLPVGVKLTEGQAHDGNSAADLLEGIGAGRILITDRAYDADHLRAALATCGAWANVRPRSRRKQTMPFSPFLHRYRNLVEWFFSELKQFHAVATRYEKDPDDYLGLAQLASARIWIRANEAVAWSAPVGINAAGPSAQLPDAGADHDFLAPRGSRADRGSCACRQFCRLHCGAGGGEDGARHHQWRGEQEGKRRRLGEQDEA